MQAHQSATILGTRAFIATGRGDCGFRISSKLTSFQSGHTTGSARFILGEPDLVTSSANRNGKAVQIRDSHVTARNVL